MAYRARHVTGTGSRLGFNARYPEPAAAAPLVPAEHGGPRDAGAAPGGAPSAGSSPLAQAASGMSLQSLASAAGKGDDWQSIASANGIENPRLLQPGQLIDLNAKAR